jgi:DNA gyrase subunit A
VLIRTRVREIRELGRATQGVTLIALDAGEKLAGLEKVVESEDDSELVDVPEVAEESGGPADGESLPTGGPESAAGQE